MLFIWTDEAKFKTGQTHERIVLGWYRISRASTHCSPPLTRTYCPPFRDHLHLYFALTNSLLLHPFLRRHIDGRIFSSASTHCSPFTIPGLIVYPFTIILHLRFASTNCLLHPSLRRTSSHRMSSASILLHRERHYTLLNSRSWVNIAEFRSERETGLYFRNNSCSSIWSI